MRKTAEWGLYRCLWLVALGSLLMLPVHVPGVTLQLLLLFLLCIHQSCCHLLLGAQLNSVVLEVELLEGGCIHQHNGILYQGLGSDLQTKSAAP